MMNPTVIALGLAVAITIGLVAKVAALSFLVGIIGQYFVKPHYKCLKSKWGDGGLAVAFFGPAGKDAPKIDQLRLRIFNPTANPTQSEFIVALEGFSGDKAIDLELGSKYEQTIKHENFTKSLVQLEFYARTSGDSFSFEMKGNRFRQLLHKAKLSCEEFDKKQTEDAAKAASVMEFGGVEKQTVADTVPGLGPKLKIMTNPEFAHELHASAGSDAAASGTGSQAAQSTQENFLVSKVWIAPGCIVCNACEDIYPEVFQVKADTCIIRPNPPLDNGLKIVEAALACPVEVIKYTKAA